MSDEHDLPDDRASLAAEHALRLLSGEERARAAALAADDPHFAADAARWRGRTGPLFDEIDPVTAPDNLWRRIDQAIAPEHSNVIRLKRRLRAWRGATAAMSALAASLAIFVAVQPRTAVTHPPEVQTAAKPPMVAMLGDETKQMKVVASWDPASRQLVLAVAGDMPANPDHAHELWVIPADGKPRSLGTISDARQSHMQLADALADLLTQGATIAISVEPPGGSPTGVPTGPVVASGALSRA